MSERGDECYFRRNIWTNFMLEQGCQITKFDPFLSLDCARVEGVGAQSNFAIWQPWSKIFPSDVVVLLHEVCPDVPPKATFIPSHSFILSFISSFVRISLPFSGANDARTVRDHLTSPVTPSPSPPLTPRPPSAAKSGRRRFHYFYGYVESVGVEFS